MLHICAARFDVMFYGEIFWELNTPEAKNSEHCLHIMQDREVFSCVYSISMHSAALRSGRTMTMHIYSELGIRRA
jgi:hypothetical protein